MSLDADLRVNAEDSAVKLCAKILPSYSRKEIISCGIAQEESLILGHIDKGGVIGVECVVPVPVREHGNGRKREALSSSNGMYHMCSVSLFSSIACSHIKIPRTAEDGFPG